jgi:uncharacterized SAM-binding protein YcdF (DUF218 family)
VIEESTPRSKLASILRQVCVGVGVVTIVCFLWGLSPLPLWVETPLRVNDPPSPSAAIVCLGGGLNDELPTNSGWQRIYTAVNLYQRGFAPRVIFSGGPGLNGYPDAEIYCEAARWMGLPSSACVLEALSANTSEHPRQLLRLPFPRINFGTRLLIVTSPSHGLRTQLVFRKAGFRNVRVVTSFGHRTPGSRDARQPKLLQKAVDRFDRALRSVYEWGALVEYKLRGLI